MTVVYNKGRYFVFPNEETLSRFIKLYGDLFTPYSDSYIQSDYRNRSYNQFKYNELKKGYVRNPFGDDDLLIKVNLTKENLQYILEGGCFTRCELLPKRMSYRKEVYKLKRVE